jgi:hypothetical protein
VSGLLVGARAIGDNQGAVSRCKAHFPSCVQNNSQAMTVAHVLANDGRGPRFPRTSRALTTRAGIRNQRRVAALES